MREYLKNHIADLKKRYAAVEAKLDAAETKEEIRSLGASLKELRDDINAAEEQLKKLEDQEDGDGADGGQQDPDARSAAPVNPMKEFRQVAKYGKQAAKDEDKTNSVEYRTAFMNFVCRGVPMPAELRADATTTTADAGAVIPTTLLNEIIRELRSYGEIYARVRRLNVQGGVQIAVSSLRAKAVWITADTATSESDKQKAEAKNKITFNYYGLECKMSQTLLTSIVTLDVFQEEFVKLAAEAIAEAMDVAIINGSGEGEPLGITKDSRVPVANIITMSAEDFASWGGWKKKVIAKMKKAYRKGVFIMAQGTFDGYIDGMEDKNGQPVGRVNYGTDGAETYRFSGKEVMTVEDNVVADYETAASGDVVAVFADLNSYGVNSNMEMTVVKWTDHDTNEVKNKAILIADGKLIDANGVLIIKKA